LIDVDDLAVVEDREVRALADALDERVEERPRFEPEAEALAHIVMALTLPTAAYLYMSRVVTIGMVAMLFLLWRFSVKRNTA
jgi:hypothetical protein